MRFCSKRVAIRRIGILGGHTEAPPQPQGSPSGYLPLETSVTIRSMWTPLVLLTLLDLIPASPSAPCRASGPGCDVTIRVNRRAVPMIVDTGADITVISEVGARRAGLRMEPESPTIRVGGVGGVTSVTLVRTDIEIGGHTEKDVLVGVMEGLDLGRRGVGLLGMTFLERFRYRLGASLELEPIDQNDPEKRGGHGPSWWRLRFRQTDARLRAYERMLPEARSADRSIEASIGVSPDGNNLTRHTERLRAFFLEEKRALDHEAARYAVPLNWRR
ncbi:MAG: TIGR02281 family clan AA aspartic protease [Myxococcota bacterium]